jgi:2-methylcitrate dehydratase PrpD
LAATAFDPVLRWAWDGPAAGSPGAAKARLLLLDSWGCMQAGLGHPRVRGLAEALAPAFPGGIVLPGCPPLGPAGAAAVLGAAMCWDEANDGLARAHGRPGLAVAPLAIAAMLGGAAAEAALAAYALGFEIGGRAGEAWRLKPGMHVDGSFHSLGAAAAAVRLLGGDPAAAARAVRLAACQIPFSLYAPISAGLDGRNSYPGHAALLGHLAGAAALAGMDAPDSGFATARGLALGLETPAAMAPAGSWLLAEAYIKPYAGVRHAHYAAAAALELRARLGDRLAGARPAAITLHIYGEALRYAGNRAPAAAISAQFSLSWAVAACLAQGDLGPAAYTDAALADPALRALEAMVVLAEAPGFTRRAARLVLDLADGSRHEAMVTDVAGDPERPMTPAEVQAKFARYGHRDAIAIALGA